MGGFYLSSLQADQRMRRHWSVGAAGIVAPVVGASYDASVLTDSPVAYYKLDETSGGDLSTIADSSGNSESCLIDFTSGTANVSDVTVASASGLSGIGASMDFTKALTGGGTVEVYESTPSAAVRMSTGGMTFECWWMRSTGFRWLMFNGLSNGSANCYYEIRQASGGTTFELKASGATVNFAKAHGLTDTTAWHLVQFVINSARDNCRFFVDGAYVGESTLSSTWTPAGTNKLYIGSRPDRSERTKLNNVAIYNTALSDARCLAHWDARDLP